MAYTEPTDTNLLLAKIEEIFPALEYKKFQHIKHGYDHDILIIDEYVYRFPKTNYYLKQLASEANLTSYLSENVDLRFPVYDYIADACSFARHQFISGNEVTKNTFKGLSSSKIDEITTNLAAFLSILHNIPNSKYTHFGFAENKYDTTLGKVPIFVPTHSDLDMNNMIWDREEGLGIIDFGDRSLFDPAFDFGIFNMFGKEYVNLIYEKYRGFKDPNFLNRTELYYQRYLSSK